MTRASACSWAIGCRPCSCRCRSGELDPIRRLAVVQRTTADLKEREQAVGAAALLDLTQYAAPTLMGLAARLVHHQTLVNLVCTNVPGPQMPLYCLGARMLEAYPMVPLSRNLNLGVAILSYCGTLHLGLLADRDQWPDLDVLEAGRRRVVLRSSPRARRGVPELPRASGTSRESIEYPGPQ